MSVEQNTYLRMAEIWETSDTLRGVVMGLSASLIGRGSIIPLYLLGAQRELTTWWQKIKGNESGLTRSELLHNLISELYLDDLAKSLSRYTGYFLAAYTFRLLTGCESGHSRTNIENFVPPMRELDVVDTLGHVNSELGTFIIHGIPEFDETGNVIRYRFEVWLDADDQYIVFLYPDGTLDGEYRNGGPINITRRSPSYDDPFGYHDLEVIGGEFRYGFIQLRGTLYSSQGRPQFYRLAYEAIDRYGNHVVLHVSLFADNECNAFYQATFDRKFLEDTIDQ